MKRALLTALVSVFCFFAKAQQSPAAIDTMKAKLARATTAEEKVKQLADLSMSYTSINLVEAERYAEAMLKEAEISRKRDLIAKSHYYNGLRYSFLAVNKEYLQKSIASYHQALSVAKAAKLDKEMTEALLGLADVNTKVPDLDKSMNYTSQAFGIASAIKNDSLQVACHLLYGNIYNRKKERLLALRSYLQGLRIAEEAAHHNSMRSCYTSLSNFYAGIKEYDKAIDFAQKAVDDLPNVKMENAAYWRVVDLYGLGNLYVQKKNFTMSEHYFTESIRVADSLNYAPLKRPGYNGLLTQYIEADQPQKALDYLNKATELKQSAYSMGFGHTVDAAYGIIYTKLGRFDSARASFARAAPVYEATTTPAMRMNFYTNYGDLYKATGELPTAIAYYLRAKGLADTVANLEAQRDVATQLDSLYARAGDLQQSRLYNSLYYTYKDSLQKLGEQKDIMQAELADEQQRQERIRREEAAALERKHTVQYTGIAIGIAVVFVLLVAMGIFRVSETTIKVMGFFSFILLFEFIILIADAKIHHMTHGEPLPVLAIKIVLIAALLPLHHWLEHKVVHYLTSRRLIIPERRSIWQALVPKKKVHGGHGVEKERASHG